MIERFVDYIQVSCEISETMMQEKQYERVAPIKFYTRGYRDEFGIRYYFGNPNSKKALVVISGLTAQTLRNHGNSDSAILENFKKSGGIFTRIDLAVTEWIEEEFFTVKDVEQWFLMGQVESTLIDGGCKEIAEISIEYGRKVQTLYIGDIESRARKGIFRAYDKSAEMGIGDEIVSRMEVEFRRESADAVVNRLIKTGDISGNFRAKFNVRNINFERLMDSPVADTSRGEAKKNIEKGEEMDSRWKWLIETVAPALKSAIEFDRLYSKADLNLIEFLSRSGILQDARNYGKIMSERMYLRLLQENDLLDSETISEKEE